MHPSSIKVDKGESLLVGKPNGKQLSIKQFGKARQCNGRSCSIDTQREITKVLTRWTWLDMRPISIVRDQGLRELLGFIEPNYRLPSTTHVSALIRKDFEDGRDTLTLQLCGHTIALTTDIWTSKATQSFATTTAHFLDKEWKLTSFVLETIHFPGNHTAIRISEKLQEVLCHYNIGSEQVSAIVHDEASNAVLAGMFYVFKLKIV